MEKCEKYELQRKEKEIKNFHLQEAKRKKEEEIAKLKMEEQRRKQEVKYIFYIFNPNIIANKRNHSRKRRGNVNMLQSSSNWRCEENMKRRKRNDI